MPADHININHPDRLDVYSDVYRSVLERKRLELEVAQLGEWLKMATRDLEAIFTRIERGEPVELHYRDGSVYVLTGKIRE